MNEFEDMPESVAAWVDEHAHRQDSAARQSIETSKLVTTFAAAISVTFVATALAVRTPSVWDGLASAIVGAALLLALRVIFIRPHDPADNVENILVARKSENWTESATIRALRQVRRESVDANRETVVRIRWWMRAQLLLSALASVVATVSIFVSAGNPN